MTGRKKGNQIELKAAIEYCLKKRATLLIADMERLGRRLAFSSGLMESRVKFICVDIPDADEMHLLFRAMLAHHEGNRISERTKAALQQAKRNGQILGQYRREVLSKSCIPL